MYNEWVISTTQQLSHYPDFNASDF